MTKRHMIDPPSGWKYGFPKEIPDDVENTIAWLLENGYPQHEIDACGDHFYCRHYNEEDEVDRLKVIASKAIREQVPMREEIERLHQAMHDIYEVYAGSEGFIPETCPEAYLQERIKEMAYIAGKHKRAGGVGD